MEKKKSQFRTRQLQDLSKRRKLRQREPFFKGFTPMFGICLSYCTFDFSIHICAIDHHHNHHCHPHHGLNIPVALSRTQRCALVRMWSLGFLPPKESSHTLGGTIIISLPSSSLKMRKTMRKMETGTKENKESRRGSI